MKFKIPFVFSDIVRLKRRSKSFIKFTRIKESKLDEYLKNTGEEITRRQYLSICYKSFLTNLLFISIVISTILILVKRDPNLFYMGFGISLLISGFILFNQVSYPKTFSKKRSKNIDKNLIPALQDMAVQLDSGVPIFKILINISTSDYEEVSEEFKKITKEINSGIPQIQAIEKYGRLNTSEYFRRVLWQISNGMRVGGDISNVIKEGIRTLSAEQAIQIQNYGNKLNPIIMFYMLITVILPSLGITFFMIISSLLNISEKSHPINFSAYILFCYLYASYIPWIN